MKDWMRRSLIPFQAPDYVFVCSHVVERAGTEDHSLVRKIGDEYVEPGENP